MAYSERYQSNLVFSANTDQAKKAIESLQNQFNMLLKASSNFNLGSQISQDMVQAQKAVAELQVSLNKAFNSTTGKLDLSSFSTSLKNSGRTLQEYQTILNSMGPAGQKAFSNLAYQIQQAEIPLRRTGKLANELWTTLKNTARWQLSASLLQGFTGAIQKAYRYSQDLNKSLNDIRIVTGASVEDMSRFAVEANKTAKALSATTNEYAKASLIYFQQGLSNAEVKERTDVTIKMANVSRESAETVSDQMTAVWNNFADGSKTLEYYADVMTALGAATASSTAEITTGLEKFAAVAETVGLSYEYATTALATITDTTRQSADVVGNALKTLFARIQGLSLGETLEDGTDLTKYSEALMKVGISIKEQDGSLREMDDILDDMASKWQTLNKDQQVALAQTVAGVRQYTQLVALMDNWDKFEMNLEVAEGAEGTLQEQADIYAESWEAARDRVQASIETIYQTLLNDEFFIDLTDGFGKLLNGVNNLAKGLGGLPGILATISLAFSRLLNKQLTSGINNLIYNLGRGRAELKNLQAENNRLLINNQSKNISGQYATIAYESQGLLQQELLAKQEQLTEEEYEQYKILQQIHKQKADSLIVTGQEIEAAERELSILERQINYRANSNLNTGKYNPDVLKTVQANNAVGLQTLDIDTSDLTQLKTLCNEIAHKTLPNLSSQAQSAFQKLDYAIQSGAKTGDIWDQFEHFQDALWNVEELTASFMELGWSEDQAAEMAEKYASKQYNLAELLKKGKKEAKGLKEEFQGLKKSLNEVRGNVITVGDALVGVMQATSQFAMVITQLQGLSDIWTDESMSDTEKMLTFLTQMGFTIPMLITSVQQLQKTFSGMNIIATMANGNKVAMQALATSVLAANGVQDINTKITLKQIAVYKLKNTQVYKSISATLAQTAATAGLNTAMLSLLGTIGAYLIPLALVAAGIALLIKRDKELKEASPEGQFKKANKVAKQFAETLDLVNEKAEEIKSTFESYQTANDALNSCTDDAEEFREALIRTNQEASKLLELYPQLYNINGAVKYDNGRIIIDQEIAENEIEKQNNAQNFGAAYINNYDKQKNLDNQRDILTEDVRSAIGAIGGNISDEIILPIVEDALAKGSFASLGENGRLNNQFLQALLPLENNLQKVISLQKQQENGSPIEAKMAVSKLLGKDFSEVVKEVTAKSYYDIIDKEKNDLTDKNISANDLFTTYQQIYPFLEKATYNASKEKYTLDGVEYDLNKDTMINAIAANNAIDDIQQRALEINKLIGNNNTLNTLAKEGASGLSDLQKSQLKGDKETLFELLKNGAINQEDYKAIQNVDFDPKSFTDTISEKLKITFDEAFGPDWIDKNLGALVRSIPLELRDEFGVAVAQTDWSDIDSAQAFGDLLSSMGVDLPTASINSFIDDMIKANNAVKNFNEANWSENVKETSEILQDLDVGGIISEEDLTRFTELDAGFSEYFIKMADGTYMLTRDAEEFYNLVREAQLTEIKEAIQSGDAEIARFKETMENAPAEYREELEAQLEEKVKTNDQKKLQGLSMARSGEEFDEMANEDEFKTLDKTSESYQRLRNAIIETEEERGKEVETLEELNKLRNKGEIGNRGYAAGLTKLAKQYPQLNREVAKYEEAMADFGKDSKQAASALNDLNNAMSAAQWKTAAQGLYDARYEIRELKAEYGSLAPEMKEYQAALQDQADALTALFGVEVSPAFAEAHADLIDEYLAGSQKAGYELMWLAEQQSGHIDTVVNQYLASTGASAEQITSIVNALNGLEFNIDGSADFTQVMAACAAAGVPLTELAKMLNALGSSHIQFDVKTDTDGIKAAVQKANALFEGSNKKEDVLGGKTYEEWVDFYSQAASMSITASGTVPKVNEFELSTVSGKKKGGNSSKPTPKEYEKDKFHTEKKTVADLEKDLERLEKQRDHAFGEDKRSFLDSEIEKAKELQSEYAKYQAAVQAELATAKTEAINVGAQIDPTSGAILNYNELMEQFTQEYNAAMAKAGDNDAAQEAAEKRYDTLVKTLETYYELYDLNEELIDTIYDLDLSVHSKELETISLYVEQVFDVTDDELKYIDWMMTKIENRAFSTAQQLAQLLKQTEPLLTQGNSLQYAFGEIDKMISQDGWTDEIGELGDNTVDNAYSVMEALLNLKNNAMDKVTEGIDEQSSALDQWIARWDNFRTIVSNMDDIFGLLGEKFVTPEMEATLDETDSQLALDNLKGTKSDLDYWTSVRDSAKEQRDAFAEGTEEYEKWDKIYRDALVEQEKCQADLTAAWKETLEAITTQYENSVDRAIAEAEKGITGFKSLEEAQKALDQEMRDKELFLEDFERAHELSNLTYDINKAMNDLSNSVAKNNMAKLLDDIAEYEKEGIKMTEYELEVLQKKFEIEQARADLEAAKTAMSQVRLTRDDEGNWSYQYTADQDKIDEATRSFEDKMYELEKLSREHIDETTATILELEQEMFEEIKNLNIEDFKDVHEFNAAKQKIVETYTLRVKELYGDIGLAIETVNGIYGTEEITFAQTTAGITSGAKSQDAAIQNFKDSTVTASGAITEAAQTYQAQVEETFPAVGTTVESFSEDYNEYMDGMTEKSKTLVEEVEGMSDKYSTAIDDIMTEVRQWQQEFGDEIDLMIQKLEELILKYNEAKAAKMNTGDGSGPKTTTTEEVPETETEDTQTDNTSSTEAEAANMASDAEELLRRVHTANLGGYKADGSAGGWKNYARSEGYSEEVISLVSKALNDSKAGGGYSYFYGKAKELLGLASGGYTGEWGPEGRLALLHQKELVLNPQDTENFLAGINILREITRMIDLQANAMASPMGFAMPFASHGGSGLEQNVHISASFPGVQDRNEIEIALRSLVNEASQFVLE